MSLANPTHRADCLCPVCKRGRGEVTKTKKNFNASINMALLTNLRDTCRNKEITITEALEEAVGNWLADESEQFTDEEMRSIEEGREQARRGETEPLETVSMSTTN